MNTDSNRQAIDVLRANNLHSAGQISKLLDMALDKVCELMPDVERANDLNLLVKTIEMVGKAKGLITTEAITNVTINQISGFEFVLDVEDEPTKQISVHEVFEEAILDD